MSFMSTSQFTASAEGAILKGVTCEQCGQRYAYLLSRVSVGGASSFAGLEDSRAYALSEARAEEALKNSLCSDSDLVPCPRCGWIQDHMRSNARRASRARRLPWLLPITASLMILVGLIFCACDMIVGLPLFCFGAFILIILFELRVRSLQPAGFLPGRNRKVSTPTAWTQEELEEMARNDRKVDIADAILDWESQKASRN